MTIFDNTNLDFHFGEKGVKREKKVREFHFRFEIYLHYYFHVTWALLEDFEIFDNIENIFTSVLSLFRPLRVGMTSLGKKFELQIQVIDQRNTTAEKNGLGKSFELHLWGLKN